MIEAFGHTDPSPSDRANYFKNLWDEWSEYEIVCTKGRGIDERVIHERLQPTMNALFEWQVRADLKRIKHTLSNGKPAFMDRKCYIVRFKNAELCAIGKLLLS